MNEQTIAFRVYKNGNTMLGIATVDKPEIQFMTETLSGSGILGEIEKPTLGAVSSLSVTLNWISQSDAYFDSFNTLEANILVLNASVQKTNEATGLRTSQKQRIVMQCEPKTGGLGTLDTGKKQDSSQTFELTRLEITHDDQPQLLIDKLNMIFMVKGIDQLVKVRQDLDMAL